MVARKTLFTSLALGLALSAPTAFAQGAMQDQTPPAAAPTTATDPTTQDPTTRAPTGTPPGTAPTTAQSPPAGTAPGAEPRRVTWSDLDADKDGKLTKTEAAPVQELTQVFDAADTDKDGALTPDEYKAFVAKNQGAAAPPQG